MNITYSRENKTKSEKSKSTIHISIFTFIICLLLCVSSFICILITFQEYNKKIEIPIANRLKSYYLPCFLFYISVFFFWYFLIYMGLVFSSIFINNYLLSSIKNNNMILITTIIGIWCFYITLAVLRGKNKENISFTTTLPNNHSITEDQSNINESELITNIPEILELNEQTLLDYLLGLSIFLFTILVMKILLQYIDYNIQFNYFKERIITNNIQLNLINELTQKLSLNENKYLNNPETIYNDLVKNKESLSIDDFKNFLGEEKGIDLFNLFDTNHDNKVVKEEFINIYNTINNEKKILDNSIKNHDDSYYKLKGIMLIIFIPLALYLSISSLGHQEFAINTFGVVCGIFIPVSFIFRKVASELFESIVFTFCVRPFDIGDHIVFSKKRFEVIEMGLLHTLLYADEKFYSVPNIKLKKIKIVNLRKSEFISLKINQYYENDIDKDKLIKLKREIANFLKENYKSYRPDFHLGKYHFKKDEVKIKINIKILAHYNDIKAFKKKRDSFIEFLYEKTKELGIL